jgi:hypothetical protein
MTVLFRIILFCGLLGGVAMSIHCTGPVGPDASDPECDDEFFCNGLESCGEDCECEPGIPPCGRTVEAPLSCDEELDLCIEPDNGA